MLTVEQRKLLEDTHRRVYDAFTYVPDEVKWRTPEYWVRTQDILAMSLTGKYEGDCDDFALIMRHELRQLNIPNRLLFCWLPNPGGYHLELYSYGWISECNHPFVMVQDELIQINISMSGLEKGQPWRYAKSFNPNNPWPHERKTI